jgi:hypothetical protein
MFFFLYIHVAAATHIIVTVLLQKSKQALKASWSLNLQNTGLEEFELHSLPNKKFFFVWTRFFHTKKKFFFLLVIN